MDKKQLLETFFETTGKIKRLLDQQSKLSTDEKLTTYLHYQVLSYVSHHPKTMPSKLANEMCMSSSSIAQLVDRLISAEYILREHDVTDKRIIHLSVTNKGKDRLKELKKKKLEKLSQMSKFMSEKDLQTLVDIMTKMYNAMEQEQKEQKING